MSSPVNTIISLGEGSWAFQLLDPTLIGDQIIQGSGVFLSTESQINESLIISDELQIYSPEDGFVDPVNDVPQDNDDETDIESRITELKENVDLLKKAPLSIPIHHIVYPGVGVVGGVFLIISLVIIVMRHRRRRSAPSDYRVRFGP